jgi:hypothetical protein
MKARIEEIVLLDYVHPLHPLEYSIKNTLTITATRVIIFGSTISPLYVTYSLALRLWQID